MRVRYGMVGGGPGSFIGPVHRMAAALDGELRLVAGCFSSDPAKSATTGAELELDGERVYDSFEAMARSESERPDDDRIQLVSIVTPNHLHHPVAKAFLEHGIHVVCDKPLTTTVAHATELCALAADRDLVFAVTYNYTGYPMVKEAQARVTAGALGPIRKVVVEYAQGWLRTLLEAEGQKQAEWRGDPERAGASSALGDIGSHAHDLVRYVTGLEVRRVFADLGTVVEGRRMEDDATLILELDRGVRGALLASQISTGERNHLRLRVYGGEGALDWCQEEPDRLTLVATDGTETVLHRGGANLSERTAAHTRLPGGHPEGFIEAFANVYRNVARAVRLRDIGTRLGERAQGGSVADVRFSADFPTVHDGAAGVRFIHAALESARQGAWVTIEEVVS